MPIDLSLQRVQLLLRKLGSPHLQSNYVHVAGTNGKGSICAYVASIVSSCIKDSKVGKFTSPHLVERRDSISLNNVSVSEKMFCQVENQILEVNRAYNIGATEFEILTSTAFQIFAMEQVDLAVIEVGLGGRLDATNVIEAAQFEDTNKIVKKGVLATGIAKIGLDHESILGSTLREIACEKAGIIKPGICNVVDGTNDEQVLKTVEAKCNETHSLNFPVVSTSNDIPTLFGVVQREQSPLKGNYQLQNLSVALKIIDIIFPYLKSSMDPQRVNFSLETVNWGIREVTWPGRLQSLDLKFDKSSNSKLPVLLDGAHNSQAAKELSGYLKFKFADKPITFIIAVTKGKDLHPLLSQLSLKAQDRVIITKFGPVDGMPWIQPNDPYELGEQVLKYNGNVTVEPSVNQIFSSLSSDENIVICGSLYLVGEVLRIHRLNSA